MNDYQYISICKVVPNPNHEGTTSLQRLADIEHNQIIKINYFSDHVNYIYYDGIKTIGTIGVWRWTITPNRSNPEKNFYKREYQRNIRPIEIIDKTNETIHNREDIAKYIKYNGINDTDSGLDFLICFKQPTRNAKYIGVYCKNSQCKQVESKLMVKKEVEKLPYYFIDSENIIDISGTGYRYKFYNEFRVEETENFVFLKTKEEILIDIIKQHSSRKNLKNYDISRKEANKFKEFLDNFNNEDIYEEFEKKCKISELEAELFVESFIQKSEEYLDQEDIDAILQEELVENNDQLWDKYEKLANERWSQIHQKELNQIKQIEQQINKAQDEKTQIQGEIERIQKEIQNKEKLANDIEQKIQQKIEDARNQSADFIAEMTLIQAANQRSPQGHQDHNITISQNIEKTLYVKGKQLENLEEIGEWDEMVDTLSINLRSAAGMNQSEKNDNLLKGLAGFLYAAYIDKIPILLAGPNAKNIANAFSSAVYGKLADQFYCEGEFQYTKLKETNESDFVTINNVFHADWIDHIDEITGNLNYCWFTNAFAENLIIEPKGLYNYMIPIVTDLFVAGRPETGYCGKQAKDFEFEETSRRNKNIRQFLKETGSGSLYRKNIELVLKTLTGMPDYSEDWDYYFALLPYAVVTGNENILYEMLESSDQNISKDCFEIIKQYLGENQ